MTVNTCEARAIRTSDCDRKVKHLQMIIKQIR